MNAEQSEKDFLLRRLPSFSLRRGFLVWTALRTSRSLLYIKTKSPLFHSLPISKQAPNKKKQKESHIKIDTGLQMNRKESIIYKNRDTINAPAEPHTA
jgi:hypothetical protein